MNIAAAICTGAIAAILNTIKTDTSIAPTDKLAPLPSPPTATTTTVASRITTCPTLSPVLYCCYYYVSSVF